MRCVLIAGLLLGACRGDGAADDDAVDAASVRADGRPAPAVFVLRERVAHRLPGCAPGVRTTFTRLAPG